MAVFGYVLKAVQSQNAGEGELFNKFYRQVKPLFSFDREDLHTHYEDTKKYPFSEYFAVVKRGKQQETLCMPKDSYVGYLKTMSGYNLFL